MGYWACAHMCDHAFWSHCFERKPWQQPSGTRFRRPSWYAYLAALLHIAFSAQVHEAEGIQCWPLKGGPSTWASRACPPLVTVPPFVPRMHRASTAGAEPCQDRACTAMLASHPGLHVQLPFGRRVFAHGRNETVERHGS